MGFRRRREEQKGGEGKRKGKERKEIGEIKREKKRK